MRMYIYSKSMVYFSECSRTAIFGSNEFQPCNMCDSSCRQRSCFLGGNGGSSSTFDIHPIDTKIYVGSLCHKGLWRGAPNFFYILGGSVGSLGVPNWSLVTQNDPLSHRMSKIGRTTSLALIMTRLQIMVSIGCIVMALELPLLNINAKEKTLELHLNKSNNVYLLTLEAW